MTVSLLEQRTPAASTLEELYSVEIGATAHVASITICNASGAARKVRLSIVRGGGVTSTASYVLFDTPLPAETTLEWSQLQDLALVAGDSIRVYANGVDVAFGVFGNEVHTE